MTFYFHKIEYPAQRHCFGTLKTSKLPWTTILRQFDYRSPSPAMSGKIFFVFLRQILGKRKCEVLIFFSSFPVPFCPSKLRVCTAILWTRPYPLSFLSLLADFSLYIIWFILCNLPIISHVFHSSFPCAPSRSICFCLLFSLILTKCSNHLDIFLPVALVTSSCTRSFLIWAFVILSLSLYLSIYLAFPTLLLKHFISASVGSFVVRAEKTWNVNWFIVKNSIHIYFQAFVLFNRIG